MASDGKETLRPDICVIGGGSGGLSVAAAAAAFGVPVVPLVRMTTRPLCSRGQRSFETFGPIGFAAKSFVSNPE